ncbi:MAG: S41 family peptidase [Acidobacteriota bacterium]
MSRGRVVFIFLSLTTVFLVIGSTMVAASNRQDDDGSDSPYKYMAVFMEVFGLVSKAYVDEPEDASLMAGAFEGAVDALDPFSLYIPATAVTAYEQARTVGSKRSGMLVLKDRGVAFVVAVEEGSPADEAGLEKGDILSLIEGRPTRETPLYEIHGVLAGKPGTVIEVERLRNGQKDDIELTLGEYERPAVVLEQHRGVPVLRVPGFYDGTLASVEESLRTLTRGSEGLPGLEQSGKLLIDLRGVAGGEESVAYAVAGLFTSGDLGSLRSRDKALESFSTDGDSPWQGDLAVLIDRGTQGAAEVLVSVLSQSTEATLVGEATFGHSGRKRMISLSDGGRLEVTHAFFTGPDQTPINEALDPDVRVRVAPWLADDEDAEKDPVLERGLDQLLGDGAEDEEKVAA